MSTSLDKLRQAMESASPSQGEKKSYDDDKYWKPELDKSGNGYAIVRFLPTPENEEMPCAQGRGAHVIHYVKVIHLTLIHY